MDHGDLVAEMPFVEKLQTQERLKHARKRRQQQLKAWENYERRLDKESSRKTGPVGTVQQRIQAAGYYNDGPINGINGNNQRRNVAFGETVTILEAASRNDYDEVKRLLSAGVDPNSANADGLSALHQCCIDNSPNILQLLIQYGADVNRRDAEMWTPLHAAATCAHLELCKILIDAGADLLALNADGNMPYDVCDEDATLDFIEGEMAKRGITQEMIDDMRLQPERVMLEDLRRRLASTGNNSELEFKDPKYGATPLHIAAANGYLEAAEFLLEHGCTTDSRDNDGWTPLHAAACWANADIVEILALHGADFDATNRYGETAQDVCDDPSIKQRIGQLREEQRQARLNGRTGRFGQAGSGSQLSRHRGGSFRGSIVRRTSMREKNALHRKDVEQERFQVLPADAPDGDVSTPGSDKTNGSELTQSKPYPPGTGPRFLTVPGSSSNGNDLFDGASPEGVSVSLVPSSQTSSSNAPVPVPPAPRPPSPTKSILVSRQSKTAALSNGGNNGDAAPTSTGKQKPLSADSNDTYKSQQQPPLADTNFEDGQPRRSRTQKVFTCGKCVIL